jgi:hypothetical protein
MRHNNVILYKNNGDEINITQEDKIGTIFVDTLPPHTLVIKVVNSFHPKFDKFPNLEKIHSKILEYVNLFGDFKNLIIDFNEIVVHPDGIKELETLIEKPCYYFNFDINIFSNERHVTHPESMWVHLKYLIEDGFLDAQTFLKNTVRNYKNILKPHKFIFFSNNINLVRIKIFNLLKETDNLKDNIWSFNTSEVYYSNYRVDLPKFFKENEGIIPYSYDKFHKLNTELSNFRFSLLPHYSTYFEILTDSFYFVEMRELHKFAPCTEKILKPIVGYQPFIIFASPKLKSTLEKIGLTFNCKLYGFYDISSPTEIEKGLDHIRDQITKTKEELHDEYFDHVEEFITNSDLFINFLIDNTDNLVTKLS